MSDSGTQTDAIDHHMEGVTNLADLYERWDYSAAFYLAWDEHHFDEAGAFSTDDDDRVAPTYARDLDSTLAWVREVGVGVDEMVAFVHAALSHDDAPDGAWSLFIGACLHVAAERLRAEQRAERAEGTT